MEERAVAGLDDLTAFLARLTGLLLRSSGEGAHLVERAVAGSARAFGGAASLLLVPEGAALTVTAADGATRTVIVHGFPEAFRLDQLVATGPLLAELRAGGMGIAEADRRLTEIETAAAPYPWWLKFFGVVLFALGFAPAMQPTWYEVATTAVLGALAAALVVIADRVPRLHRILPLTVSTVVSIATIELFANDPAHGGPVLLMLPALFYFVPGDYLSAATAELAAGLITTGAIRLVYSIFLLIQLYVGVLFGVFFAGASPHALFDVAGHSDLPRWALFLAWIVFVVGTLLAFAIPLRFFWVLLLLVYVAVGVQSALTKLVGETGGTFVAAVVLAAAATVIARGPRRPPRLVLMLPGFFTLTVGSLGLRGLSTLAGGYVEGFRDLLKLVTIVTALAVGLVVGGVLVHKPGDA
ncbi:threonine/serine exporter family protein [Amycolatopsis taiwanensis]|uniref:threonine/serine exporter family protein n=1 Tax=Amycolatopsis taiwanensis TaxID=342230 RepID=UPI0004B9F70C|nr:threonine/serine exporter family protein [Amycolatopsis taiwanensis]